MGVDQKRCENGFNRRLCLSPATVEVEVLAPEGHEPARLVLCHHHLGLLLKRVLGKGAVVRVTYIGEVFEDDFA